MTKSARDLASLLCFLLWSEAKEWICSCIWKYKPSAQIHLNAWWGVPNPAWPCKRKNKMVKKKQIFLISWMDSLQSDFCFVSQVLQLQIALFYLRLLLWLWSKFLMLWGDRNRSELKRRHNKKTPVKAKVDYIKQTGVVRVALKCFLTQTAINQGAHTLFTLMVAAFSMR